MTSDISHIDLEFSVLLTSSSSLLTSCIYPLLCCFTILFIFVLAFSFFSCFNLSDYESLLIQRTRLHWTSLWPHGNFILLPDFHLLTFTIKEFLSLIITHFTVLVLLITSHWAFFTESYSSLDHICYIYFEHINAHVLDNFDSFSIKGSLLTSLDFSVLGKNMRFWSMYTLI